MKARVSSGAWVHASGSSDMDIDRPTKVVATLDSPTRQCDVDAPTAKNSKTANPLTRRSVPL